MKSQDESHGRDIAQHGYAVAGGKKTPRAGWCKPGEGGHKDDGTAVPDYLEGLREEQLTLFGTNDEYLAIAASQAIVVLKFDHIGQEDGASRPIVQVPTKTPATHLLASGSRNPLEIVVADRKGKIWAYDFAHRGPRRTYAPIVQQPNVTLLADGIEEPIYQLIGTRRSIFIQAESPKERGYRLYKLDRRTRRLLALGDLNLDKSLGVLRPNNDQLLVGSKQGELRLIEPNRANTTRNAIVRTMDLPRVSAATMLTGKHVVIAQKRRVRHEG